MVVVKVRAGYKGSWATAVAVAFVAAVVVVADVVDLVVVALAVVSVFATRLSDAFALAERIAAAAAAAAAAY